jgi:endo-1,4-beta-xylanase
MLYKQLHISKKRQTIFISVVLLSSLIVALPAVSYASRRNHHYHATSSRRIKPTVTPKVSPTVTPQITGTAEEAVQGTDLLKGQWDFMPGASRTDKGLLIHDTDLSIVSQDGNDSVANPPINAAGTYVKDITGDVSISADLQIPKNTTATVQLYSALPVIADEFKIEKPSVQMAITDGQMLVKVWNGNSQNPSVSQSFSLPLDGTLTLVITRQKDMLQFSADGVVLGSVKASSLFTAGTIWFGFDSNGGDWMLSNLSIKALQDGKFTLSDASTMQVTNHNPNGLQALATKKRPGFLVGMALALNPAVSDSDYANVAFDNAMFGSMTPENDMKMINLQPQRGVYTFQKADALVKLANQNGINDIHGHTLVFAEANPPWFNALPVKTAADKQDIEKIMIDHITTVVKHFGDKVTSWDVVNEPIADYDEFDADSGQIMRNHTWYKAMGKSYVIKAFTAAHAANPHALLSINEYGLEEDGERWDTFLDFMKQFKTDLQNQNIPVANISVGFQAHVYESGDKINTTVLREHIRTLADLGFKSQISENDVYSDDGSAIQSTQYASILNACISEPSCVAWRGWMLTDKYDVFEDGGKIEYGADGLFDNKVQPRPAFKAMQQILTDSQ